MGWRGARGVRSNIRSFRLRTADSRRIRIPCRSSCRRRTDLGRRGARIASTSRLFEIRKMRGLSLDLSAAASSFVSVDVDSSWGSCKRPAGRASSPVVVDKSSRTALISAGPSAGASAAGVLSSIEPYMVQCLLVYFQWCQAPPRPVVKRHDTNGNGFPSQISNRQTPKPRSALQIPVKPVTKMIIKLTQTPLLRDEVVHRPRHRGQALEPPHHGLELPPPRRPRAPRRVDAP